MRTGSRGQLESQKEQIGKKVSLFMSGRMLTHQSSKHGATPIVGNYHAGYMRALADVAAELERLGIPVEVVHPEVSHA